MTTNIPASHPIITILRQRVEERLGETISSQQSVQHLESELGFALNGDTIRRIWMFRQDAYSSIRHSTLDTLSRYAGYADWDDLVRQVQETRGQESELMSQAQHVSADEVGMGEEVELSWLPDRRCVVRYDGDYRWTVIESEHSTTLSAGDTFWCRQFIVGREALLDHVTHEGHCYPASRIGLRSGLSAVVRRG